MAFVVALAGDTMLGRKVAEEMRTTAPADLFATEVRDAAGSADVFVVNLECCISDRGERWPDPRKPFFFRAPPRAVEGLEALGVDAVTLANNHALDYGEEALHDTLDVLEAAGIATVGAGRDREEARRPAVVEAAATRVGIVGLTDHPVDFAAEPGRPGVAYADLRSDVDEWVTETVASLDSDVVLVTPHWGPNMTSDPVAHVRRAAPKLAAAGASVVAGHSAHVFHGVDTAAGAAGRPVPVCFDLGDFIDDYAVDPVLRNDLGLLWFVVFESGRAVRVETLPLALDYCHTRLADAAERQWIEERFTAACAEFDLEVVPRGDRLVVDLP